MTTLLNLGKGICMSHPLMDVGNPQQPIEECDARLLPPPPARLHFLGIGGVGMSGLALTLLSQGYLVSGSDAADSRQLRALADAGVATTVGHTDVDRAAAADVLIVTRRAVQRSSPELEAAVAAGVPVMRRGEVVGALFNARQGIAVAGSHGKSTTTGMLVWTLRSLGLDPSFAIGAEIPDAASTVSVGTGPAMVAEADEFDHQFLWLRPEVSIITNVEFDHPDVFATPEAYEDDFRRFAGTVRPGGTLLMAGDDAGSKIVLQGARLPAGAHLQTFGEHDTADWRVEGTEGAWNLRTPGKQYLPLSLAVPGRHNARNAAVAIAALVAIKLSAQDAVKVIASFPGVGRRFEIKGDAAGVTVVDDYAHHPTEVRATIRAARGRFPGRRLWAVFQPHTFSRTKALLADFAEALSEADRIAVADIYGATETDDLGISSRSLVELIPDRAIVAGDVPGVAARLVDHLTNGDVVLTLGAGTITAVGPAVLALLSRQKPTE